ncbi:VipE [Legionella birminghamensis]|nr:VipE [Legionella birminghamensis]
MATAPARENVNAEQIRKLKKLVKLCENYKNHLQRSTTKDPSNLANQKYDIVSKMLNSLSDPAVPDPQAKISNMEAHLTEQNKGILQTRRNSSIDQIFLEGLFNVLTLGIYSKISKGTFAFWKTHGEVVVEDIDEIKNQPKN